MCGIRIVSVIVIKFPSFCIFDVKRWVPWLGLAVLLIGSLSWIRRPGDFAGYVEVGELVLRGGNIYRDLSPQLNIWNAWPPLFSLFCVPLALVARPTPYLARGMWLVLNFLLLWVILKILVRMVYNSRLSFWPARDGFSFGSPEILIPLALASRFIVSTFEHLQVSLVIFTVILGGLSWISRGRPLLGGAAIGLAAALKVMPLVFLPFLFYRRRYRAALSASVAALLFSLAPALVFGWQRFVEYLQTWLQDIRQVDTGVAKMNQSVFAMFDRFIGHHLTPFNVVPTSVLPESGHPAVLLATVGLLVVVTLLSLWLFRGRIAPTAPASLAEYGVVLIVSAVFGSIAWKFYFVVLLLPLMLLAGLVRPFDKLRALSERKRVEGHRLLGRVERRVVVTVLVTFFVLVVLTPPGLIGQHLAGSLLMLSNCTFGTLILLATLLWLHPRLAGTIFPPRGALS